MPEEVAERILDRIGLLPLSSPHVSVQHFRSQPATQPHRPTSRIHTLGITAITMCSSAVAITRTLTVA
eukprot:841882-Pleurochrysis_carterae.AAC.1